MRLIEKVWFHAHPAKWLLVPILFPLSLLFHLLSALRRYLYKIKTFKSYQVAAPVMVVGNIGIGGNGKTPMVILLIELCQKMGLTPGVISRGYGGKAPHYPYLLCASSTSAEAGDEPVLIYQRCQIPVVVGADRIASANLLIKQGCNIIIADDGLQHYRLQRDVEFIIVDGKRGFGNGLLLPAGPLRENTWRLASADFVIQNGGDKSLISDSNQLKTPVMNMRLTAQNIKHLASNGSMTIDDFIQQYPQINAIAGIGSPERFFKTLTEQRFQIIKQQGFIDHHHFKADDFNSFDDKLPLLMTEKDAVKCQSFAKQHWWYLPVSADIAEQQLDELRIKIKHITR